MKRIFTLSVVMATCFAIGIAQSSVGINTDAPDASAALDIVSADKGMLMPRLDSTGRMAIANPAHGLMVFDISTNSFWFYTPEGWDEILSKADVDATMLQMQGVKDIDNNVYETVQIGNQIWMAENLRVSRYNDGSPIPLITAGSTWSSITTPGYCWYENGPTDYGALYNWWAVDQFSTGGKNVCPVGWHVPSEAEWATLSGQLGGDPVAGGKMKETGIANWYQPNAQASNESGFHALPSGFRFSNGAFFGERFNCGFWSSTQFFLTDAWSRLLEYHNDDLVKFASEKDTGLAIRCVKD